LFLFKEVETYLRVDDLRTIVLQGVLFSVGLALSLIEILSIYTSLADQLGSKSPRKNLLKMKIYNDNKGTGEIYIEEG